LRSYHRAEDIFDGSDIPAARQIGICADAFDRWLRRTARSTPLRISVINAGEVYYSSKARYPIAYADAFAAALALELQAPLLTGDPDFQLLERDGALSIEWIA
jgi:hypothetical protein